MDVAAANENARKISSASAQLRKIVPHPGSYVSESNYFSNEWLGGVLEADLFTRTSRWLVQFFELIKNDRKVFVVRRQLANNSRELSIEFLIRFQQLTQLYEGPHDCDVDLDSSFAIEDTREHRDPLLRESIR